MKSVLVTGATGLVGSTLCKKLIEKNYKVKALVRKSSNTSFLDTLGVEYIYGDLTYNKDSLKDKLKNIDIVFHCAAQVRALDIKDNQHFSTNVKGTKNILDVCVSNNIEKFIYVSTLGVTGIMKEHHRDKESLLTTKDEIPYYDTKVEAEKLVMNYYNDKNLPIVILRPGFIYGQRDRNGLPEIIPHLLKRQITYIGHSNNIIALTSVNNLADALILSSENDNAIGNIYNITDGNGLTQKDFVRTLTGILDIPEPKIHISVGSANKIAKISQIFNSNSPLNEHTIALISNDFDFDISKARKDLGYKPKNNFEQEMKESVKWYFDNYKTEIKEAKNTLRRRKLIFSLGLLISFTGLILLKTSKSKNI